MDRYRTKLFNRIMLSLVFLSVMSCSKEKVNSEEDSSPTVTLLSINQHQLNNLAETLQVKYRAITNVESNCPEKNGEKVKQCFVGEISFTSPNELAVKDWQINYSQVYPVYASESEQLDIQHINGDLHQVLPKENFAGFKSEQTLTVKIWVASTLITESELMPNYWLSGKNLNPAVIESTKTTLDQETALEVQPWVIPFDKNLKSNPKDINQYASATWLYEHNADIETVSEHLPFAILPTPTSIKVMMPEQRLSIATGINIHYQDIVPDDISAAVERLAKLGVKESKDGVPLHVKIDKQLTNKEGYHLSISAKSMTVSGADPTGVFYGIQSIASLLSLSEKTLPLVEVDDQPKYTYRGQHIDVARNFHDKAMILRLIEQMAAYKLNKLHMHLAEDEGWRIELPSLPELTEIGGQRCMDLSDKQCMQPQLGGAGATERDGFYTVKDYIDILKYAKRHHIQVIPSLDMPGHSRAAIKAMEARYQRYIEQENEVEATRYLLSDFNDITKYNSIQNYHDNTINVCMESSYAFVDRVLEDLISLHKQAEHPLQMYHIGADETAGAWVESPACQALVADKTNEVNDIKHLGAHFIERVANMVVAKGISVGGWNDGLGETNVEQMPKDVYSYIWGALPWGAHQMVSEQARRNWHIVLSIPDVFYFDFPYEVDPKERGYKWASRRVDSRNVFNFMPDNLPIHAEFRVDTLGHHFTIDDTTQTNDKGEITHQPLPENFKVSGIQGQLWSETVRSETQAEYMIFPRMIALAERAWSSPNWHVPYDYQGKKYHKDSGVFTEELQQARDLEWQKFSNILAQKELPKLDALGVFYRVPTAGAKIINNKLHLNSSLPGLPLEYKRVDGVWQSYQKPVEVTLPVEVRSRSANGQRAGRSLPLQ
ncbi:family 20 glycosylhydrolase [Colwelliaceae bacterium 6441]